MLLTHVLRQCLRGWWACWPEHVLITQGGEEVEDWRENGWKMKRRLRDQRKLRSSAVDVGGGAVAERGGGFRHCSCIMLWQTHYHITVLNLMSTSESVTQFMPFWCVRFKLVSSNWGSTRETLALVLRRVEKEGELVSMQDARRTGSTDSSGVR